MMYVIVVAIAASLALTPLAKALAWKFNVISWPDGNRRLHSRPTPLLGGGSVYLALLLSIGLTYSLASDQGIMLSLPVALALSAAMLCLLGIYDDLRDIGAHWKLLGQGLSTLPIVFAGGHVEQLVVFGTCLELGWLGVAFTIGWLVVGINAMNLLDGMDGLASVVGIAIAVSIAAIGAYHGHPAVMLLALALAGALAGFLVYNLPPARIYLGDCGSMIIGITLALLALRVSFVSLQTANLTVAVVLLFVPLADTGLAIVRRTLLGSGLMVGDRGHVHHRLLDRGFSIWIVLGLMGGACLATGTLAWLVAVWGQELWVWVLLALVTVLAVHRRFFGHEEWKLTCQLFMQTTARLLRRLSAADTPAPLRRDGARPALPDVTVDGEVLHAGPPAGDPVAAFEEAKKAA